MNNKIISNKIYIKRLIAILLKIDKDNKIVIYNKLKNKEGRCSMEKYCKCGKTIDDRINYCVHCGKETKRVTTNKSNSKKNVKSVKYSPLLEIFKG